MSYYVNAHFLVKNQIEITFIENPHKFWYKYCNDATQQRLLEHLENSIEKYMKDLFEWGEQLLPISYGDVIATNKDGKKWIRGKAGKIQKGSQTSIKIWAIDYGCEMLLPLDDVFLLKDKDLACRHPINVHIGGLSGISPAYAEFNFDTFETEVSKVDCWSPKAAEIFNDWICDKKKISFEKKMVQSGRSFGRVLVHSVDDNIAFCVAQALCDIPRLAILDKDYMSDVRVLSREDFLRLNHEMAFWKQDEIDLDDNVERIWMNEDRLSSIDLKYEYESQQENTSQLHQSNHSGPNGSIDERFSFDLQLESASHLAASSQNLQSTHSGTQGLSSIAESSLSTVSLTISVKTLNKLNVLVITENDVMPTKKWSDAFYFNKQMRMCLSKLFPNGVEAQCSYGWPHIMRSNSLLLIGEPNRNLLLCLPTICSVVHRISSDWSTSARTEPFAIIFVPNSGEVERVARLCQKLLAKSDMNNLNVFCLNSSFEIGLIEHADNIDILVTSVFCSQTIAQRLPKLFRSQRLRYIWFHQIDEMCQINELITYETTNRFLSTGADIQVVTTSSSYCPIISELFHKVKLPMLSIGDRSPFEAALFAKCHFEAEFLGNAAKIKDLIAKLQNPNNELAGSIVIMCASKHDVKHVTGCLTQANIKCIELDGQYSGNQMKLVSWTKRCLSTRNRYKLMNILVCADENLSSFPIRTATHIVHYSLPNKLNTFKQRYITCYGFYADRLRCQLVHIQEEINLHQPQSLVYFDDHYSDEYIHIFELLQDRTKCELPVHLTHTVEQLRFTNEQNKLKSVCTEMITKTKDCDVNCPYRHVVTSPNETMVPEFGFVNMELLEIIAPNHFSVRITAHKRSKEHRSKLIENDNTKWLQFEEELCNYYTTERRENHRSFEIGDMCLIFHRNKPKRCRVLSKSKATVSVYLIDIGRVRNYSVDDLYFLDDEFQYFPSQSIEVFALGYVPSDCNPNWLPESKQYVVKLMKSIKERRKTENYLQAEIIHAFERTLIVKDLKIMYKGKDQHQWKSVGSNLIKYHFADKAEVVLHDVFVNSDGNDNSGHTTENSQLMSDAFTGVIPKEGNSAALLPPATHSEVFSLDSPTEPVAPANSIVSFNSEITDLIGIDHIDGEPNENEEWNPYIADGIQTPVSTVPSLDDIFGCSAEIVEAAKVLSPIKCDYRLVDDIKEPKYEEWLIDFSDSE